MFLTTPSAPIKGCLQRYFLEVASTPPREEGNSSSFAIFILWATRPLTRITFLLRFLLYFRRTLSSLLRASMHRLLCGLLDRMSRLLYRVFRIAAGLLNVLFRTILRPADAGAADNQ